MSLRCVEDVTRRSSYGGSYRTSCDNPGEFVVRVHDSDHDRPLKVCRIHLPVLIKRVCTNEKRHKPIPVRVTLAIHEEESGG